MLTDAGKEAVQNTGARVNLKTIKSVFDIEIYYDPKITSSRPGEDLVKYLNSYDFTSTLLNYVGHVSVKRPLKAIKITNYLDDCAGFYTVISREIHILEPKWFEREPVWFGKGLYRWIETLKHELTHYIQHEGVGKALHRQKLLEEEYYHRLKELEGGKLFLKKGDEIRILRLFRPSRFFERDYFEEDHYQIVSNILEIELGRGLDHDLIMQLRRLEMHDVYVMTRRDGRELMRDYIPLVMFVNERTNEVNITLFCELWDDVLRSELNFEKHGLSSWYGLRNAHEFSSVMSESTSCFL